MIIEKNNFLEVAILHNNLCLQNFTSILNI